MKNERMGIKMTITELARLVAEMRTAQRAYFRTRSESNLKAAKDLEAKVDRKIADLLEPRLFE